MKVLFISHANDRNGATVSMITLLKALQTRGNISIDVLVPGSGKASDALLKEKLSFSTMFYFKNYRRIGKREIIKEKIKDGVNTLAVWRLKKIIKKKKYDYICSNSSAVDIGARAAIACGIQHIYYVREFMEEDFSFEYRNQHRMRKLIENSIVIFISHAVEHNYINRYNITKYKTFYNGIEQDKYFVNNNPILMEKTIRFIQIGSLSDGKGTKKSIEYMEALRKEVDCHLRLIGNGESEYCNMIIKYIQDKHLEDCVSIEPYHEDVRQIFLEADILLMNSESEGFGRVTVEGMYGGLLVMGKNRAGTAEIISHEQTGILFENKREFVSAVKKIDQHRSQYREMAKKGQAYACEEFAPIKTAMNFQQYLEDNADEY